MKGILQRIVKLVTSEIMGAKNDSVVLSELSAELVVPSQYKQWTPDQWKNSEQSYGQRCDR
jgi:hypothetical protein